MLSKEKIVNKIDLKTARCTAFEGDEPALTQDEADILAKQLSSHWVISVDILDLSGRFKFSDYYETMDFVNKVVEVAHKEDHHPYLEIGYNRCMVRFKTHTLNGLSVNDFICAAKTDAVLKG